MSDMQVQPAAEATSGLSQWQRVASTFSAPSKTFEDIKRGNRSWWMPLIIFAVVAYALFAVVALKIGMQQVVDNQIHLNPAQEEKLAQAPPAQREMSTKISVYITEGVFIANPALVLAGVALLSLGLWGTINFVFGGKAKYGSIFTVWMYASLPGIFAFLNPLETNKALYALASSLDVVTIWTLVLLGIGAATVAGVKRSSGYIAVFGWWAVFVLAGAGIAAIMG